jgi:hypothetical protein
MNWPSTGRPRNLFFDSWQGGGFFPPDSFKPFLCGAHKTFYPEGSGGVFPSRNRLWREGDRSPPSSTEVKSSWRYTRSNSCVLMECCLIKQRDNFTYLPHYIPVTCRPVHIFLFRSHKGPRANTHRGVSWRLTAVVSFAHVNPRRRRRKKQHLISLAFRRLCEINK